MIELIKNLLIYYGVNQKFTLYLSNIIAVIIIIIISLVVDTIVRKVLLKYLQAYVNKTKVKWDDILLDGKILQRLAHIVPIGIIHASAPLFPTYQLWIEKISFSFIVIIILLSVNKLFDAINEIYSSYEISKTRPIKGYLQVIQIILYTISIIILISILIDRSPWFLLSGIGAATAIIILIFQNSILGLVASIQITSNNMLQIGDWIEMSKYGADGDVLEISLHTVKIQNFDKTITTIPTHALLSESFRNWRGMQQSGGRRIKRSIYLDMTSIKFCNEEMLKKFEEIQYIKEYLKNKRKEIDKYNKDYNINNSNIVNGRRLTNIGIFRIYIESYLKNHPKISKNMIHIVRQLQPSENGLPIELYAFTNKTEWIEYEGIQADIFDHILAVVPEFDLRIYQCPTGYDLNKLRNT